MRFHITHRDGDRAQLEVRRVTASSRPVCSSPAGPTRCIFEDLKAADDYARDYALQNRLPPQLSSHGQR
jgi:hypothetical protein